MVDDDSRAKTFLTMGAEVLGESAAAGAIGFFFGGPIGAAAGAATPVVAAPLKRIVGELAGRLLSHREKRRVASAAFLAASQIKARLERGDALRTDGFFDADTTGRPAADELLEGVLLKCRDEYQEKKFQYIANIFANVAFREDIGPEDANHVLRVAENLSYRQFVTIGLVHRAAALGESFAWGRLFDAAHRASAPALAREFRELSNGLVHGFGNTDIPPFLEPLGRLVFELLALDGLPEAELRQLAQLVKREMQGEAVEATHEAAQKD
jgi:hypothetical protein